MPILPLYEPYQGTIAAKVSYEISLQYQIKKVLYFCEELKRKLDEPRVTNYINDDEASYYNDSVINNFATLVEYYFSYVIYSVIGTVLEKPKKHIYKTIEKSNYSDAKDVIFKKFEIGKLTIKQSNPSYKEDYIKYCHDTFDKSIEFLVDGKYDVVLVINNFIKHNCMNFGYAPLVPTVDGGFRSFHYIRMTKDSEFMLQDSILKTLVNIDCNELEELDGNVYRSGDIEFNKYGRLGGIWLLKHNGVTYTKAAESAGITSDCLLDLSYQLCLDILEVMIRNHHNEHPTLENLIKWKARVQEKIKR